jgi:deoxyadenosine/deoxycytidine kinase
MNTFWHKDVQILLNFKHFHSQTQQCSRVISFFDRKYHSHLFSQVNVACINLTLVEIKIYNILLH